MCEIFFYFKQLFLSLRWSKQVLRIVNNFSFLIFYPLAQSRNKNATSFLGLL